MEPKSSNFSQILEAVKQAINSSLQSLIEKESNFRSKELECHYKVLVDLRAKLTKREEDWLREKQDNSATRTKLQLLEGEVFKLRVELEAKDIEHQEHLADLESVTRKIETAHSEGVEEGIAQREHEWSVERIAISTLHRQQLEELRKQSLKFAADSAALVSSHKDWQQQPDKNDALKNEKAEKAACKRRIDAQTQTAAEVLSEQLHEKTDQEESKNKSKNQATQTDVIGTVKEQFRNVVQNQSEYVHLHPAQLWGSPIPRSSFSCKLLLSPGICLKHEEDKTFRGPYLMHSDFVRLFPAQPSEGLPVIVREGSKPIYMGHYKIQKQVRSIYAGPRNTTKNWDEETLTEISNLLLSYPTLYYIARNKSCIRRSGPDEFVKQGQAKFVRAVLRAHKHLFIKLHEFQLVTFDESYNTQVNAPFEPEKKDRDEVETQKMTREVLETAKKAPELEGQHITTPTEMSKSPQSKIEGSKGDGDIETRKKPQKRKSFSQTPIMAVPPSKRQNVNSSHSASASYMEQTRSLLSKIGTGSTATEQQLNPSVSVGAPESTDTTVTKAHGLPHIKSERQPSPPTNTKKQKKSSPAETIIILDEDEA